MILRLWACGSIVPSFASLRCSSAITLQYEFRIIAQPMISLFRCEFFLMEESRTHKSMKEIRRGILWESFIILPAKCFYYGALGGGFAALAMILIDGGWNPAV